MSRPKSWMWLVVGMGLAAGVGLLAIWGAVRWLPGRGDVLPPQAPALATGPAVAAPTPAPEPAVPVELATPMPGLDGALAQDYRRALVAQGIEVVSVGITDRRATGGVRQAAIFYRTRTDGTLAALRPEVIRVLAPGANPKLALDRITVRVTHRDGTTAATIALSVADLDRWLKTQIGDDEFFSRWTVRGASR